MATRERLREWADNGREQGIALFRIAVGVLFLSHGMSNVFGLFGKEAAEFLAWPGWWAGIIQLVAGVLVALGTGTRTAALVASGSMACAYFVAHQPKGLLPLENGGVPAALYAWAFFVLVFTGPGAWAVESLRSRGRIASEAPSG